MPDPLADLYDAHAVWLWRTARSWLTCASEADDAVQEVFTGLARSGSASRIEDPRAYLATSLAHACARLERRRSDARVTMSGHEAVAGISDRCHDERLDRALAALPREQRQVVALKTEGDLTFAAIAACLGISPNTAASRWRLAIARLRHLLPEEP